MLLPNEPFFPFFYKRKYPFPWYEGTKLHQQETIMQINSLLINLILVEWPPARPGTLTRLPAAGVCTCANSRVELVIIQF